jgi:hypothetical protein
MSEQEQPLIEKRQADAAGEIQRGLEIVQLARPEAGTRSPSSAGGLA